MANNLKYYPITYGQVFSSWHIIFLVNKHKSIKAKDAISIVAESGKLGGTVPAKKGMKICLDYGLIRIIEGKLFATELSEKNIIPNCSSDDLNIDALRSILLAIISFHNFEWLIYYDPDPAIFKDYIVEYDREWTYLLENANLFDFDSEDVIIWWGKVLSKYEESKNNRKKAIGDVGEYLTYQAEKKRVEGDGYSPGKAFVKWASNVSDRFGFDVLSIRGKYFKLSSKELEKIQIEVKSSDNPSHKRFRFYISKPEWLVALDNLETYYFYCWAGIDVESEIAKSGPFIIPAKDIQNHIPSDNSEDIGWSECRCILDISEYPLLSLT